MAAAVAAVLVWRWILEVAMAPVTDLDEQYDTALPHTDPYLLAAHITAPSLIPGARLRSLSVVDGEWRPQYIVFDVSGEA